MALQQFETELKQSENKVQELKDKVTEMLEKNPNSPEASRWKQMLDKIGTIVLSTKAQTDCDIAIFSSCQQSPEF